MDKREQIIDIAERMERLADDAGLPRFDRVRYAPELDELMFLWEDRKLAVIIELTDHGPTEIELAEQMVASFAGGVN